MSLLGRFNTPRLLRYDDTEYLNSGYIGVPSSNLYLTPLKDMDWDNPYGTYNATMNAYKQSINEFILALSAHYRKQLIPATGGNDVTYNNPTGLTTEGKNNFVIAANNISDLFFEHYCSGKIFWNCLIQNKLSGQQTINFSMYKYGSLESNSFGTIYNYSRNIVFDVNQEITAEIYQNYINSLKELMFAIKTFLVITTNSTLEVVDSNNPFDFTVPTVPPYFTSVTD